MRQDDIDEMFRRIDYIYDMLVELQRLVEQRTFAGAYSGAYQAVMDAMREVRRYE